MNSGPRYPVVLIVLALLTVEIICSLLLLDEAK